MNRFYALIFLLLGLFLNGVSQTAEEFYSQGISAFNQQKYSDAISAYNRAIDISQGLDTKLYHLYLWRGKAKFYLEDKGGDNGYGDFQLALKLKSDQAEPYKYLAFISARKGNDTECVQYLEEATSKGLTADSAFYWKEFQAIRFNNAFYQFLDDHHFFKTNIYVQQIKQIVEQKVNLWQKKGKFEKTIEYTQRVNVDTRNYQIQKFTKEALDSIALSKISLSAVANEYDADNETFKLVFNEVYCIYLNVPLSEAENFDKNFKKLKYEAPAFTLDDNRFYVLHVEIENPENGIRYIYDSKDVVAFSFTQLNLNFDDIDLSFPDQEKPASTAEVEKKIISVGRSDVDILIPENPTSSDNRFALIIGNEDYTKYQPGLSSEANVLFAGNDARVFAKYVEKTLGIPRENITILIDAIGSVMKREIERVVKMAQMTKGEIIFYYAGHGFPDEVTKDSYIMPVDITGANVRDGIRLSDLYAKLSDVNISRATVFIDACFSGGGRDQGLLAARAVRIKPQEISIGGNLVVFAATSEDQISLPYKEHNHGMFTYFLLKKLQTSMGNLSYKELADYLTNEVGLYSIKINYKEQTPAFMVSPLLAGKMDGLIVINSPVSSGK